MRIKEILVVLLVVLPFFSVYAQEEPFSKKFALGFQLTQSQKNFGMGLNATSPYFANAKVAIRLRGNIMWNEHLNTENTMTWSPYSNLSLGVVGVAGEIGDFLRLYGEGGMVILFPSTDFSEESYVLGGYGLFGFEFFINRHSNYFIEIGGIGTGAVSDKLKSKPIYSNGLLINVGYRYQF